MPMKINRPDGISQENRSHPFFILLRKFADTQKDEANVITKNFILYGILGLGMALFTVIMTLLELDVGFYPLVVALGYLSLTIITIYRRYRSLQMILKSNSFEEVDHMIYSNDYQLCNLNMEKLVNMIAYCAQITGRMETFNDTTIILFWIDIGIFVVFLLTQVIIYLG